MEAVELRLAKLEAAEEIRALKARYAKVCDHGYIPEEMVPLFTEDAVWTDVTDRFGTHEGRDAICEFFGGVSAQIAWAAHYMIAPAIEVDDDLENATGTWYLWQPCTIENEPIFLAGTYFDRYRREDDDWKMCRLELTLEIVSPLEEGWVRRPFAGD